MTPEERVAALRYRIFPCAWSPDAVYHAVAEGQMEEWAWSAGHAPVACVPANEMIWALQQTQAAYLKYMACDDLHDRFPMLSARNRFTLAQAWALAVLAPVLALPAWYAPAVGFAVLSWVFAIAFLMVIGLRIFCLLPPAAAPVRAAQPLRDSELPDYSVLVPLYREVAVLDRIVPALLALAYPPARLDIKLVLEEDDLPMRRACAALRLPPHVEILVVPPGGPRTKPKALNYALQFARGELVTVFDAEDIPEPQQLRVAAAAFAVAPPDTACLQARLAFYNPAQNWLTRQFAIEYAVLFDLLLPALAARSLPLPLGGTSNHFRTAVLRGIGAWDPCNVTEDADLGMRLSRAGFHTGVIASRTYEEANSRLGNWLKQRARWLKGWGQTWLVHMREPRRLYRDLGAAGFWTVQALFFGIVLSALLHPVFLGLTAYALWTGQFFPASGSWLTVLAVGIGLAVLVAGYVASLMAAILALRRAGLKRWPLALATLPLHWLLISLAAWRALYEFIVSPHGWNKTEHGLAPKRRQRPRPRSATAASTPAASAAGAAQVWPRQR